MKKNLFVLMLTALVVTVLSPSAHAIHLEAFASAGYGEAALENEAESPNMGVYQLGGTVGYNFFPMFYAGVSGGYQQIVQFSETNRAHGNRKGNRFDLAPTLGFSFMGIHAKYELKVFGDYSLDKKTSSGQEVTYKSPMGHRLSVQFPIFPMLKLGAYFETIEFDEIEQGSTTSSLTNALDLTHYGLVFSVAW